MQSIATCDLHPFAAVASADGSTTLAHIPRALRFKSHRVKFAHKLFRLDFHRRAGLFRMHDNLAPQQRSTVDVGKARKKGGKVKGEGEGGPGFESNEGSGGWGPEVGVLRCAWGGSGGWGLGGVGEGLVASGMACGLVRVDWVEGGP